MKKFKFGLDGLLKLREFKEKRIKAELGEIVGKMEGLKSEITAIGEDIVVYYEEQDTMFDGTIQARDIQQFPRFIQGLKAKREIKQQEFAKANDAYKAKMKELALAMADVK